MVDEYFKFHPVPNEPAIKGDKYAKVIDVGYAKVSGAICYDFDFPLLGQELSHKKVDIAVVPSSDWRGIDPIYGLQAMVRAIEGGYSLLRLPLLLLMLIEIFVLGDIFPMILLLFLGFISIFYYKLSKNIKREK